MALAIKNSQSHLAIRRETVKRIASKILSKYRVHRYEINIDFLDNAAIRKLNRKYLNHNCPTDVLAFPYPESDSESKDSISADIAISAEMAISNSKIFKTGAKQELCLYIVHGLLHLIGFDDTSKAKRIKMRKEEKICIENLKTLINKL